MRWATWLVAALLLLWAVAWLAVPPIVKSQVEQRLTSLLGREVRIGKIGFSPWSLQLTLEQFSVASAAGAGAPPQLSVGRLMANADMRSLLRLAPVIEALEIDTPVVRVARVAGGRYDFDDIALRLAKAPAEPKTNGEPARFALYNLRLQGGAVEFDDQPVQRVHRVQDLQIALPSLSNLPDDVAVDVLPRLAFKLNGAAFDSGAQSKPFAQDRASQIDLNVADLDLAPWLPYVPTALPWKPSRGKLATQLQLQFALAADGAPRVSLRGKASLADAALVAAGDANTPAVAWQRLDVALTDVQPLARKIALGDVTLAGAQIDARRSAEGRINLVPPALPSPTPAASAPANAAPWQVSVAKFALTQARIDWHDASTRPAAALRAEPVVLQVSSVRWPFDAPAPWKLTARVNALGAQGAAAGESAALTVEGQASDRIADARADLQGLNLAWLEPYLAASLNARVEGRASAKASLAWAAGETAQVKLSDVGLQVEQLELVDGGKSRTPLSAGNIALADATVDLATRQVSLGILKIDRPSLALARDAQGRWNFEQWIRTSAAATPPPRSADNAPPWSVKLGELQLTGGEFRLDDQRPAPTPSAPVQLRGALNANVRDLAWPSGPPAKTQLQLRISQSAGSSKGAPARTIGGGVDWNGTVAPSPLAARGTLRLERSPCTPSSPTSAAA